MAVLTVVSEYLSLRYTFLVAETAGHQLAPPLHLLPPPPRTTKESKEKTKKKERKKDN